MGLAATVVLTFTVMLHFGLLPTPIKEEAAVLEAHLTTRAKTPPRAIGESERAEPTTHRRELLERLRFEQAIASSSTSRPAPHGPGRCRASTGHRHGGKQG